MNHDPLLIAYLIGKRDGYAAALRDAVEAIFTIGVGWTASDDRDPYWLITKVDAAAAIEALDNHSVI